MRKRPIGLVLSIFLLAASGCGGDGGSATQADTKQATKRCAAGDGQLRVADVLDQAPPGLEIVKADMKALKPLTDPLRTSLGSRLRGFDARAVVPKGEEFGTAVVIVNANEATKPDGSDVLEGAREGAKEEKGKYEEITVADKKAAIVQYGDVHQIAVPLGRCSVGMLIDQDRKRLLAVADALHAPDS